MLSVVRADTVVSLGRPSQHHRTCGAARQSVRHREFQRRANLRRALVGAEGRGAEFETKRVDERLSSWVLVTRLDIAHIGVVSCV